jgi:hypothetical protein
MRVARAITMDRFIVFSGAEAGRAIPVAVVAPQVGRD